MNIEINLLHTKSEQILETRAQNYNASLNLRSTLS